jgi:hypothetical protein
MPIKRFIKTGTMKYAPGEVGRISMLGTIYKGSIYNEVLYIL